jgi:protein arginine kinase
VSNLGLTVRGVAGEGSESRGFYFQLSNQVTLGQSAEEMRDNLKRVTGQITDQERQARQSLANEEPIEPFDQVWRSYGMLRYARSVDTTEALETLSHVRLGVDLGWIEEPDLRTIDGLMVLTQPAHLNETHEGDLNAEERDRIRATRLRNTFSTADPVPEDSDDRADSSGSSSRTHEK